MTTGNAPRTVETDLVRAELLRRRLAGGRGGRRAGIGRADRDRPLRLSAGQEQMWFLSRLEPESHEYLVPLALRLTGPLDAAALGRALDGVVARHEILRTRYALSGPDPEQVVDPARPLPFPVADLGHLDGARRAAEAVRLVEREAGTPIDVATEWPLRVRLIRLAAEEHVLVVVFHHIACDAWSTRVFAEELSALYRAETGGEPAGLPAPEVQYADYAAWQRERLGGSVLDAHLAYWRDRLSGLAPLELPTDRPRPAQRGWQGAAVPFRLPAELTAAVRNLALAGDTTVFTVMLAAFQTLLSKYSGSTDISVGTVASSRVRPELQRLIGYGINSLVLRGSWDGDIRFARLLERAKSTVVDAYDHQEMPFGRLADELQPERDLSRTPLFQVAFTMHESRTSAYRLPGIEVEPFDATGQISRFDLTLQVEEGEDGSLQGQLEYATALFDEPTIKRMTRHLVRILEVVSADPKIRLSAIGVLDEAELAVLVGTPGASAVGTDPRLVHQVFEQQVIETPGNVAVVADGVELTYAELNERANRVAHHLRGLGIGPEDLVGICLERGAELMPALLGILKSGAGYLPLDPANPVERLAYVVGDAGAKAVLTESRHAETVAGFYTGPTLVLDRETERLALQPSTNPEPAGSADQLIYVIYTSGSTGRPKGVCLSHRNVLRLETSAYRHYRFSQDDVWPLFHSYAFDVSVFEMWGALLHGGRLVVVPAAVTRSPEEFLDLLVEHGVTVLNQTPSAFRSLVAAAADGDERIDRLKLRAVVFAGEKLPVADLQPWVDRVGLDRPVLANMYGITETTVHTTYHRVAAAELDPAAGNPIGRPLDDLRVLLLDGYGRPVPIGVVGEIHVAGPGVARGYLGRPELTAQRFVPDPFGPPGTRLYRSGDLARRLADGSLEFLGRTDDQIKIRGYRVELGEIETALTAQPGVRDAVVVLRDDAGGGPELVAYLVPLGAQEGPELPSAAELRTELGRGLPSYMVPAAFVVLERLPLTTNGKLDRRALPAPGGESRGSGDEYTAPRTFVEQQIAAVWSEVLGLARVSVRDGFFELGGDSIRAVALVGALRAAGFDLAVRDVFEYRTVARLAELLTGRPAPAEVAAPVRPFQLIGAGDRELLAEDVTDAYPLSQVQTGMVMEMIAQDGDNLYHNVTSFRIRDEHAYQNELMIEAARLVTARHEVLRTSIDLTTYSVPMQLVHAVATMPVGLQSLRGLDDAAIQRELHAYTVRERANLFDLAVPSLMRLYVHDTGDGGWWLSITECHPVLEGWSHHSLLMELLDVYDRLRDGIDVPETTTENGDGVRFADFIAAELESLGDEADQGYWRKVVDGHAPLTVPSGWGDPDYADPAVTPVRYQAAVPIDHLEARLRTLATKAHASLKSVLLAAHLKVMSQLTHETAIHTGLVCDARPEMLGADRVYGMYLNTVPFAFDAAASATWLDLVGQVFAREIELWPHRRFPLPAIQRLAGGRQLLDVYFNYQDFRQIDTERIDYLSSIDDSPTEFPLTVSSRSGFVILTASSRHLAQEHVDRLASMYRSVLESMAADGGGDAWAPYLPGGEAELVVSGWNDTATDVAAKSVPESFAVRVAAGRDVVAVSGGGVSLTFGELDEFSGRVAHVLKSRGVVAGDVVGVFVERSPWLVGVLLGVWRAGAAYVPLDRSHPVERVAGTLADAGARVLVASEAVGWFDGSVVRLDDVELASTPADVAWPEAFPDSAAYVLYTSGSTGRPKGVVVSHGALGNLLTGIRRVLGEAADEVWLASTSVSFDISGLELFLPLVDGQRLVVAGDEQRDAVSLLGLIAEHGVTHVQATPSGWKLLLEAGFSASTVAGLVGGEALPVELAGRLRAATSRLVNVYGPTETTIWSSTWEVPENADSVSLGVPIDNTQFYIVDSWMQPVAVGVVGELCIAGDGVARGYLGRADLTAERFVPNPFDAGTRLYRTGDLARRLSDGEIEFLGRTDHQVKVRGYRIELGEIESALNAHPQVRDSAVIARTEENGDTWLVAYVIAADDSVETADLREFLRGVLPEYMAPGAFVEIEAWPLNAAGKLDRKALPSPERATTAAQYVAPRTEAETRIAQAWAQALGVERVSVQDSFFDLGGDSIRAIVLVSAVRAVGFQVAVKDVFEHRTVAALAAYVAGEGQVDEVVVEDVFTSPFALITAEDRALLPEDVSDAYPVSQVQLGMLVEMSLDEAQAMYHNVDAFRVRDALPFDVQALQRAATELVARHEILRTGFHLTDFSTPLQLVHAAVEIPVTVTDLTHLAEVEQDGAVKAGLALERATPFDMTQAPGIRFNAHVRSATDWQLVFTHAHPILEGWSYHSLMAEVLDLYQQFHDGNEPEAHEQAGVGNTARYADFIAAELESLEDTADQNYWRGIVDGRAAFTLPTGWGDESADADARGYRASVAVHDLDEGLRTLATQTRTSMKSVLVAAHLKVLSQLTHETAFVSGLVCDARPELAGAERVYGMHLNTVPFAFDGVAPGTWRELVSQVFAQEMDLWPHRRFPLPAIQRLAGGRQLLDVYFNYQDFSQVDTEVIDFVGELDETPTQFPLTVSTRGGHLVLAARSRALSRVNVERVASMYRSVLEAMAADGGGDARAVYLPAGEAELVVSGWNDTATGAAVWTVPESFAARVAAGRDVVAVSGGGVSLTYGELYDFSARVAHVLMSRGVVAGDVVGVLVGRSPWLVGVLLGVWRAGAAYVPLDRSHPVERVAGTLVDAGARVLVASEPVGWWFDGDVVELGSGEIESAVGVRAWPEIDRDAAAYVLYTSGSTGRPKGVVVPHGALGNLLTGIRRVLGEAADEVWLASTSVSFDISGLELFLPLVDGQRLVVAGDAERDAVSLLGLIAEHGVTHVQATPSGWKLLLEAGFSASTVAGLVGGEALPVELAGRLRAATSRLVNVYGPTETTIWSSTWEVPENADSVSLGVPIDNTQFYIVDSWMQPVAVGVVGELCIAGDGVARGYLGRADLTAERFVPNPFDAGTRLYRTGDLARRLSDGEIEFLGRTDHQVKVRGYRIELGEIESALNTHPRVRDSAVIARTEENGDTWLVAYLIPQTETVDANQLREFLRDVLPEYMVPGAFVEIEAWPLNAAGKLDRKALPSPERTTTAPFIAPRTDAETRIAQAWAQALGLEQVSVEDSFFDLGGDSIRAVTLVGALKALGYDLTVSTIFRYQTVAELAEFLAPASDQEDKVTTSLTATGAEPAPDAAEALAGALRAAGFDIASSDVLQQASVADLLAMLGGGAKKTEPETAPAAEPSQEPKTSSATGVVAPFALISAEDRALLPEDVVDAYPLSQVQAGMVVEALLEDGGDDYHRVTSFRVRDKVPFDAEVLRAVVRAVIARHEVLRSSIELTRYAVPMQLVHATAELPVAVHDFRELTPEDRQLAVRAHVEREQAARFDDLGTAPLLRVAGLVESDEAWWLGLTHSHIMLEGWSHHSLLMEIVNTYRAVRAGAAVDDGYQPTEARFADFIAGELESLEDTADHDYWRGIIADHVPVTVPTGWGDESAPEGTQHRIPVSYKDLEPKLRMLAGSARASLKSVLLAAHLKVMSQLTRERRITAGLVFDARPELAGAERVYGMHLNTVPFAFDAAVSGTWRELVGQVFAQEMDLWPHRRFPLPRIQRLAEGQPVVDVLFTYQNYHQVDTEVIDVEAGLGDAASQFPLAVSTLAGHFILTADGKAMSLANVERVASMYRSVLESMAADGGGDARAVYLPEGEAELVVSGWNDTATGVVARLVPESFAVRVAAGRDVVAVSGGGVSLTFGELDEFSGRVAHVLRGRGVVAGDVVGVLVERSPWLVGVLLGVWRAGAAYVPLDRSHPVERVAGTLADAGARVLVASEPVGWFDGDVVELGGEELADAPNDDAWPETDRDAAAYVLYTSGSTGRPKGVVVSHGALGNLLTGIRWVLGEGVGSGEVWLASTSVSFDISGLELFQPLVDGQRLIVAADEQRDAVSLLGLIAEHGVTHVQATPSGWKLLLEAGFSVAGITGLVGGEALPVELAGRLSAKVSRLVNVYGPTETTIWSSTWEVPAQPSAVSIGAPIDNTQFYIVDDWMQPVAIGVVGELCIAGDGVARGYLGRPDLTAERFVPNPFDAGTRLYRTGDLARRLPDGEIEFLGRTDHQVKVRGYRIELGEIESALNTHPGVRDSAVIARTEENGDTWLVAYVIAADDSVETADLREFLRGVLPEYMAPGAFVEIEAWPLNAAGKLDRKALPSPERATTAAQYVAPRTEAETRIAQAWAQALGLEQVSVEDSFFDLGGDSIRAIVLVGAVRAAGFQVAVKDVFEYRTVAALASHLVDEVVVEDVFTSPFALITAEDRALLPDDVSDAYPVSQVQLGMLVEMSLDEAQATYHNVDAFRVRDALPFDVQALQRAATELVARHEILRTGFHLTDFSTPLQLVHAAVEIPVTVTDITHLAGEEFQAAIRAVNAEETARPFDTAAPPLLRVRAALEDESAWWLVLTHAHPILEGWSYHSLMAELLDLYREIRDDGEPAAEHQQAEIGNAARYADFIAAELESLEDTADQDYWRAVVAEHGAFTLAADWARPTSATDDASYESFQLNVPLHDLAERLRALAVAAGASMKSVVLAAHLKVLSQLTDQRGFHTGLAFDARPELAGAERVAGMHLNTVPFRHDRSAATWRELVGAVFARELELWPHRRFPFPAIQRAAGGHRIVDVIFNYLDFHQVDTEQVDEFASMGTGSTEFPLAVVSRAGYLSLRSDTRHLGRAVAERIAAMYRLVFEAMAADAAGDARRSYLPAEDLELLRLTTGGRQSDQPAPTEPITRMLHEVFAARVARTPEAVAVVAEGASLTYAQLDAKANRLAHHLCSLGVGVESVVGVCLHRGAELVPTLLGVLKAGAAYLPMDPVQPPARLAFMAEDQSLAAVLTQDALAELATSAAAAAGAGTPVVVVDGADEADLASRPDTAPRNAAAPDNLAYVIYTSGSTGRPKGVGVTHANVDHLLRASEERFDFAADHTWALLHSYAFDVSVFELWAALLYGARLVVAGADAARDPDELLDLLVTERVTAMVSSPSAFRGVVAAIERHDPRADALRLRALFFGGEKHTGAWLAPLLDRFGPDAPELINSYGPTESTVQVTHHRITPEDLADPAGIQLGLPIPGVRTLVLDQDGWPVPVGVPGELYLGGPLLARGYAARPSLTAESFVPDPQAAEPGARMYRTGDLVRVRPDGGLDFVGRVDDQVKIRGYRVELGEIQAVLAEHPSVAEAVVAADSSNPGGARLVAYLVPVGGTSMPASSALVEHCAQALPDYMIPSAFIEIERVPLTANTKIDYAALPAPDWTSLAAEQPYVAPRSTDEAVIARIWARVLGLSRVGVEDSFFEVGGDSIRAVSLIGALREAGYDLAVRDVFDRRTVAGLAQAASGLPAPAAGHPAVVPFALVGQADRELLPDGLTDAYPVSQGQLGLLVETLVAGSENRHLNVNAFRIREQRPFEAAALRRATEILAGRHDVLRTSFALSGYSVPLQLVHAETRIPVDVRELRGLDRTARDSAIGDYLDTQRSTPFDLERPPLLRICALVESDEAWWLGIAQNHAITEGWSHHALLMELLDLYRALCEADGAEPAEPESPQVRYADFVAAELESLASEDDQEYWRAITASYEPFALPAVWGDTSAEPEPYLVRVPFADVAPGLRTLARSAKASMKAVLHAAHLAVLSRLTEAPAFCAGLAMDARPEALGAERVLGMHLNTVPFAVDKAERSWRELVAAVYAREAELWPHRRFPLPAIQRQGGGRRLVEVAFNYQDYKDIDTDRVDIGSSTGASSSEFALIVTTLSGNLSLATHTGVLSRDRAELLAGMYRQVLLAMAADPESLALAEVPAGERAVLLEWAVTPGEPVTQSVPEIFAARVAQTPDAVAVSAGDEALTYAELDAASDVLAARLRAVGAGAGTVVALGFERSAEFPTAALAVLKTGAAYLPLDPSYPAERLAFMLADSAAVALLTSGALADSFPAWAGPTVLIDAVETAEHALAPAARPHPEELAYVMYTSGSTGTPKATTIPHRGIVRTVCGAEYVGIRRDDVIAFVASVSFDATTLELWGALLNGARLEILDRATVLDPHALAAALRERGISLMFLTASLFKHVVRTVPDALAGLRVALTGGEAGDPAAMRAVLREGAPGRLVHMYGPTENSVFSSFHEVSELAEDAVTVPIGRANDNSSVYVVDSQLRLVPRGVVGELCVGGPGLAHGYLNRAELTAQTFVPDPYAAEPGERMYRTGDLVRWVDGALDFVGRADDQVKLRGYRIELGEVEAALLAHPAVANAAVVLRQDAGGDKRLVGYFVPADADAPPAPAALREHLLKTLPDYAVPAVFVALPAIPLMLSGKLDARALPEPDSSALATVGVGVAPRTADERKMAGVWAEVLGLGAVGVEDSFFDLGGDSIRAVTLVGALKSAGYDVSVSEVFSLRTIAALAEAVADRAACELRYVRPFELIDPQDRALVPADVVDAYPLSRIQTGMLVELMADNRANNYHNTTSFDIKDGHRFELAAMREAARLVTARHEALRISIDLDTYSVPMQLVHAEAEMSVVLHDLTGLDRDRVLERVHEISRAEMADLFDVRRAPLVRLAVAQSDFGWRLFLSLNHTIIEGWGHYTIWMELLTAYTTIRDGGVPQQAQLPEVRFADFIAAEHESLASDTDRDYWRDVVEQYPPLALPGAWGDRTAPARSFSVKLSLHDLQDEIRALAARTGTSPKSVLLAAHLKVMSQLTEERDFCTGLVCDSRPEVPGSDQVIGMYINTLPFAHRGGARTWRELIGRVFDREVEFWPHRRFPLPEVQRVAGCRRVIDSFFNYLDFRQIDTELMDLGSSLREGGTEFDLSVTTMVGELGLLTNTGVMSREQANQLAATYRLVLESMIADLDGDALAAYLPAEQRELVLREWSGATGSTVGGAGPTDPRPVHHRFAAQAAQSPDAVAVRRGKKALSYAQLDRRANRLARHLIRLGVGRGDFVGILLERGEQMLVAVLGALKAGAAYLPLDPETPAERMAHQLHDSAAPVLITQERLVEVLPEHSARLVVLDRDHRSINALPAEDPRVEVGADDLAYTIYTSGSTGRPKGVLVTHGGLANYLDWALRHYGMDGADGAPMFGSIAFDLAVPSFLLPLISGRPVTMVPRDEGRQALPALLRAGGDYGIVKITPAHLDLVCAEIGEPGGIGSVRTFVVGGEEMKPEMVAAWRRVAPGARIVNEYGPTETVVGCIVHDATETADATVPVPIGRPITGTEAYVLDARMQPVAPGVVGELYLGGAGVARGYHGRPGLTAEKFVPHPYSAAPGARLYRTGDLARFRPDGGLDFLGRRDDQVKIRGYRVELGEIEATLLLAPGVRDAAVLAREDRQGERRLVGYMVPEPGCAPTPDELTEHLRRTLPPYMVPAAFVQLDALPLAVSGKVDRRRLPAPDAAQLSADVAYEAPRTETERVLAEIWADALGLERVGLGDSFFRLGGDSIMVLPVISAARKAGLTVSLRTLYESETLGELAAAVAPAVPAPAAADADPDALAQALKLVLAHQESLGLRVVSEQVPDLPSPLEVMTRHHVPGASVAVIRDGEVAEAYGYGTAQAGQAEPVTARTLFPAGSISKHVSALGVLRLVKDGVLDLDADANSYLRGWRIPVDGATVEHLLRFTSGVTTPPTDLASYRYRRGDVLPTAVQLLSGEAPAKTPPVTVEGEPGQMFLKNNIGYTVLQQLMEDVTGRPFADLMRELVLEPLGMHDSSYRLDHPETSGLNAAVGHDEHGAAYPDGWAAHPDAAAAGLWTTAADLARVAVEIRRAHRGLESAVLTAELADRMLTIVEPGRFYGMGSVVDESGDDLDYGHTGRTDGYHAMAISQLRAGSGVVVLTNGDAGREVLKFVMSTVRERNRWSAGGELTRLWEAGRVNPNARD
jgi:amino acid adenylation domain-containing protein